ncbi:MAG: aldose epimerase [Pseudoxanthomonas sp.]
MAADPQNIPSDAMAPFAPGPLIRLSRGNLQGDIAPQAGGRIAQITHSGIEQLAGFDESNTAMIGWGCYPMLPWAGRVRQGRFEFGGQHHQLSRNMGAHSIHGVGFAMPWQVEFHDSHLLELSLVLPQDERWPFGGSAHHRMELDEDSLLLRLAVQAGSVAMPATIGWHPWFRKPERLRFTPNGIYPRDEDGIATLPVAPPLPGPWDDCFINSETVELESAGQQVKLSSDCTHWVVYDQVPSATCIEPQSGPPDAFNIEPFVLSPGETLARWFRIVWDDR